MYVFAYVAYSILFAYLQFEYVFAYVAYFESPHAQHAGLIDSEDDEPAQDMPEQPIEVGPPDNAPEEDEAVPAPPPVAADPWRVPDMHMVMQRTGGPNYEDMLRVKCAN